MAIKRRYARLPRYAGGGGYGYIEDNEKRKYLEKFGDITSDTPIGDTGDAEGGMLGGIASGAGMFTKMLGDTVGGVSKGIAGGQFKASDALSMIPVVGGLLSPIAQAFEAKDEQQKANRRAQDERIAQDAAYSSTFPTTGTKFSSYFAKGGFAMPSSLNPIQGGKVMPTMTGDNEGLIVGNQHENGGVKMATENGNVIEAQGGETFDGNKIFSNEMNVPGSNLKFSEVHLKLLDDKQKTMKKAADKVSSLNDKVVNPFARNTFEKTMSNIDTRINNLFSIQQMMNGNYGAGKYRKGGLANLMYALGGMDEPSNEEGTSFVQYDANGNPITANQQFGPNGQVDPPVKNPNTTENWTKADEDKKIQELANLKKQKEAILFNIENSQDGTGKNKLKDELAKINDEIQHWETYGVAKTRTVIYDTHTLPADQRGGNTGSSNSNSNFDSLSFNDAFGAARKQGLKTFTWKGKSYGTNLAKPKYYSDSGPKTGYSKNGQNKFPNGGETEPVVAYQGKPSTTYLEDAAKYIGSLGIQDFSNWIVGGQDKVNTNQFAQGTKTFSNNSASSKLAIPSGMYPIGGQIPTATGALNEVLFDRRWDETEKFKGFKKAMDDASLKGLKTFTWNGKEYGTKNNVEGITRTPKGVEVKLYPGGGHIDPVTGLWVADDELKSGIPSFESQHINDANIIGEPSWWDKSIPFNDPFAQVGGLKSYIDMKGLRDPYLSQPNDIKVDSGPTTPEAQERIKKKGKFADIAPYIDNIANAVLTGMSPKVPLRTPLKAAPLNTTFDINAQLAETDRVNRGTKADIDRNTSSSSVARGNKLAADANSIYAKNSLYNTKENTENQLENQKMMNDQMVGDANNQKIDQFNIDNALRTKSMLSQTSANIADAVGNYGEQQREKNKEKLDIERWNILSKQFDSTGVIPANFADVKFQDEMYKQRPDILEQQIKVLENTGRDATDQKTLYRKITGKEYTK